MEGPSGAPTEVDVTEVLRKSNEEVPVDDPHAIAAAHAEVALRPLPASSLHAGAQADASAGWSTEPDASRPSRMPGLLRRPTGAHFAGGRTNLLPSDVSPSARQPLWMPTTVAERTKNAGQGTTTSWPASHGRMPFSSCLGTAQLLGPAPCPGHDFELGESVNGAVPAASVLDPTAPPRFGGDRSRLRQALNARAATAAPTEIHLHAGVAAADTPILLRPSRPATLRAGSSKVDGRSDLLRAGRNAGFLGLSLVAQYGLAFVALLVLPRLLSEQQYGLVTVSLRFCELLFVVLALGTETYVRRVVSVRPEHAAEFLPGLLVFRLLAGGGLLAIGLVAQQLTGRGNRLQLVVLFGLAQICIHTNTTTAAVLHAIGDVRQLSRVNSAAKLLWLVMVVGGLKLGMGLSAVPLGLFTSECVKSFATNRFVRRHLHLPFRVRPALTAQVIRASLPFLLLSLGPVLTTTLDVNLMDYLTGSDREIGWYGLATQIALLALGLAPVISWTLQPVLARAASRSMAEFEAIARSALHYVLACVIPVGAIMSMNAATIARLFPSKFAPAARSLAVLAVMFIVTYVAQLVGMVLVQLDQGWFVARVTFAGVILNALANLSAIPYGFHHWGRGGAGVAAALTFLAAETLITLTTLARYGFRRAFDSNTFHSLLKTVMIAGWIALLHYLALHALGFAAPVVELCLFLAAMTLFSVIDIKSVTRFIRNARNNDRPTNARGPL